MFWFYHVWKQLPWRGGSDGAARGCGARGPGGEWEIHRGIGIGIAVGIKIRIGIGIKIEIGIKVEIEIKIGI